MRDDLFALFLVVAPLTFATIGGASGIYVPLQHQSVDVYHWISAREFLEFFAIARVTPGPGSMITTLIGWKVAGWSGALIATLALFVPGCMICYAAAGVWNKYRGTEWHSAIEAGLRPIAAGIVLAAIVILMRLADTGPVSWAVVGLASLTFVVLPRIHPALVMIAGAAVYVIAQFAGLVTL